MKLISLKSNNQCLLSPEKDQAGKLAPVAERSLYAGAKVTRLDSDLGDTGEINRNIYENLAIMRQRSRQLAIDDNHVGKFLRTAVQEILGGKGLKLSVNGPDEKVNKEIERLYDDWGKSGSCTTSGQMSLLELEKLEIRTRKRDGEFFCRIIENHKNKYGFSLFPFEADRVELGFNDGPWPDGSFIQNSIEYDRWLKPIAYHILERHPGDNVARWPDGRYRMRIPANEIIQTFEIIRAGQGRGIPATHSIIISATHLKAYVKATIVAARVTSSKFGVITKKEQDPWKQNLGKVNESKGEILNQVEAGRIFSLRGGEDFTMFDPKHPSNEYAPFTKSIKQDMGVGTNIPYAEISGDLEGTSFASGRLGALSNQDFWDFERTIFSLKFKERIYQRLLNWLYLTQDSLANIVSAQNLELYRNITIHSKPVVWIDPGVMSKVIETNLRTGVTTLHKELAKQGIDYNEHIEELIKEAEDKLKMALLKKKIIEAEGGGADEQEKNLRLIEDKQANV
jgi:lambda family phage portal protein